MKLSIGIFNALLFLLVILIIHFSIKNFILDKKESFDGLNTDKPQYITTRLNTEEVEKCEVYNNTSNNLESEKENMLKYVLDESDELDKYFKDRSVTNVPDDGCKQRTDQHIIPLNTTCDPQMNPNEFNINKEVIADCELPQDKKHYSLLKVYDKESTMSGAPLYGGINAYDDEEIYYSKI
jgi:hypothetical protein